MNTTESPLLSVRDLSVAFGHGERQALAVDRISFDIRRGETLALVGESGSCPIRPRRIPPARSCSRGRT